MNSKQFLLLLAGVILGMCIHNFLFILNFTLSTETCDIVVTNQIDQIDTASKVNNIKEPSISQNDNYYEYDQLSKLYSDKISCNISIEEGTHLGYERYSPQCEKSAMTDAELYFHKLCLVVPFRDSDDPNGHGHQRSKQLEIFKRDIKLEMELRGVDYLLFVAEQEESLPFNRAALLNAGFLSSYHLCDYFIFHDVDLLPQSMENTYEYPHVPTHCYSSTWQWKQSQELVGGVLSISLEQFLKTNGFSNSFWGWGWEDNDMYFRIIQSGQMINRLPYDVGRYRSLRHDRKTFEELLGQEQNKISKAYFEYGKKFPLLYKSDGLSSINATISKIISNTPDYIHLVFELHNRKNLLENK